MDILERMNWRYATKRFDPEQKISSISVDRLAGTVRMAATSLGLQGFKLIIVNNRKLQQQLDSACMRNQKQPGTASHVFVFAATTDISPSYYGRYIERAKVARSLSEEQAKEFQDKVSGYIEAKTEEEKKHWLDKQVYLAMGHLLLAAAIEGVDACPMEGFHPEKVDEILGLPEMKLRSVLLCPLGFRSQEDGFQHVSKVRLPPEEFLIKM